MSFSSVLVVVVGFDSRVFSNARVFFFRLHTLWHVSRVPFFSLHICTVSREKKGEGEGAAEAIVNRIAFWILFRTSPDFSASAFLPPYSSLRSKPQATLKGFSAYFSELRRLDMPPLLRHSRLIGPSRGRDRRHAHAFVVWLKKG